MPGEDEGITTSLAGESTDAFDITLMEYDGFNQLKNVITANTIAEYAYDPDGLRIEKSVNGVKVKHIWDGSQLALEVDNDGVVVAKYIRGINLIAAEDGAGSRKYYMYNGHGDVIQLTDTSGNVIKNYDYDAFGNELNIDNMDTNPFRYCGEYFDKETGTIYLRARYYDPATSRMLSEDSYWGKDTDPLSLNLYIYCKDNPIMYIDPTGHLSWVIVWEGVKKVGSGIKDFVQGVGSGILQSISYCESDKIEVYYDRDNELIYLIGKTVGSGAVTVIGTISTIGCVAGDIIVAPTGVGELVTVPATVYCGSVTVSATANTGRNIAKVIDKIKNGSSRSNSNDHMFGENGTQVTSKTVWKDNNSQARLDVENPKPGQRPGQIHYQDSNGNKYLYDPKTNKFINAPNSVNKLLENSDFVKALNKALTQYLGEPGIN